MTAPDELSAAVAALARTENERASRHFGFPAQSDPSAMLLLSVYEDITAIMEDYADHERSTIAQMPFAASLDQLFLEKYGVTLPPPCRECAGLTAGERIATHASHSRIGASRL